MTRAPSQRQKCTDDGLSDVPSVAPEASGQDFLGAVAEARLGDLPGVLEGIGVAELVRSMSEVDVRTVVDEVRASGFVQTLEDASQALAAVEAQAVRRGQ